MKRRQARQKDTTMMTHWNAQQNWSEIEAAGSVQAGTDPISLFRREMAAQFREAGFVELQAFQIVGYMRSAHVGSGQLSSFPAEDVSAAEALTGGCIVEMHPSIRVGGRWITYGPPVLVPIGREVASRFGHDQWSDWRIITGHTQEELRRVCRAQAARHEIY